MRSDENVIDIFIIIMGIIVIHLVLLYTTQSGANGYMKWNTLKFAGRGMCLRAISHFIPQRIWIQRIYMYLFDNDAQETHTHRHSEASGYVSRLEMAICLYWLLPLICNEHYWVHIMGVMSEKYTKLIQLLEY